MPTDRRVTERRALNRLHIPIELHDDAVLRRLVDVVEERCIIVLFLLLRLLGMNRHHLITSCGDHVWAVIDCGGVIARVLDGNGIPLVPVYVS